MRPPDITCSGVVRIWIWMSCSRGHQPTGRTNDFISAFDAAQQPRLASLGHICLKDMHSCRNQRDNRTAQQMTTYVRDCPRSCTSHRGPSTKATIPFHSLRKTRSRVEFQTCQHQADALTISWLAATKWEQKKRVKRNAINDHCPLTLPYVHASQSCTIRGHASIKRGERNDYLSQMIQKWE